MWIMLNDAFFSIVSKHCPAGHLLVRARRPQDIEKVFGRRVKVTRAEDADYLFRAVIPRDDVERAMASEIRRIDYDNFKDSVKDHDLHIAYMRVWTAMADVQEPPPYSMLTYWRKSRAEQQHRTMSAAKHESETDFEDPFLQNLPFFDHPPAHQAPKKGKNKKGNK